MKNLASLLAACAALTACGGGSGNSGADSGGVSDAGAMAEPASAGPTAADNFTSMVSRVVDSSSDSAEPEAVDTASADLPEDTEPTPVS
ncbi:MAG: hypothetical protein ACM34A_03890 [Bacillota bacterium]